MLQSSLHPIPKAMPLFSSFFFVLFFASTDAQVLIPRTIDGFWYENRLPKIDSVNIEAFFDPVCPDSRDSWPPLKKALLHYGPRVSLAIHTFPLPYHDNAFVTSRALHVVNKLNTSATYILMESFFKYQEKFYGMQTLNMSRKSVIDQVTYFAIKAVGDNYYSAIASGFQNTETNTQTRISFKYGCSRGVFGTPFFFVNGFALPDAGSPLNYKGWRKIIDPLFNKQT